MQENDIQIRGFPVRLHLDLCLAFTANPEDYTNRGSIITPLEGPDRQPDPHPLSRPIVTEARAITDQEARGPTATEFTYRMPDYLRDAVERIAFEARSSEYVDQSSGVSARLPITALECVISNLERRGAALTGEAGRWWPG